MLQLFPKIKSRRRSQGSLSIQVHTENNTFLSQTLQQESLSHDKQIQVFTSYYQMLQIIQEYLEKSRKLLEGLYQQLLGYQESRIFGRKLYSSSQRLFQIISNSKHLQYV
ncbi:hypothetical protein FGO68_gene14671 [Halteria grandinella]|uniref:Uncharacterized protein n=1 Tax=Halteria grandinella TaxID=5974 RepID=A0A8J8NFQ7_HALGN|nr:hypothetical protein FGO68_gene14671 [Halteria grandinella]